LLLWAAVAVVGTGCLPDLGAFHVVRTDGGPFDAGSPVDAGVDATMALDAPTPSDGAVDGGQDAASDGGHDASTGLDPYLALPPGGAESCSTPGSLSECAGITVCRFYSPSEGRCETCEPCGNLADPCTRSSDCDILFSCYRGQCTNFCELGTYNCGPIEECIDVGHPTYGVCWPP